MKANPMPPVHIVVWDWHNVFDYSNFRECKINLAHAFQISIENLENILERCDAGNYLKGTIPSSLFWERVKEHFPRFTSEINLEREKFLTPDLNIDVIEFARNLHDTYPSALFSNASDDKAYIIKSMCNNGELSGIFDLMLFSCDVRRVKQSIQSFNEFHVYAKMDPCYCLIIDDNVGNLKLAETLGYQTLHFTSPKESIKRIKNYLHFVVSKPLL